ncbi:MAG: hypothetical protein PHP41_02400 [Bacilli bacterium]|jgi:hypothetical protein|nr:hypothetical protein [Bacilli bacterium]
MDVQWFSKSFEGVVTVYETNITLNTVASAHFKNAYRTLIGYDQKSHALIIKSISKDEVAMGLYKEDETHQISIKPSYGRINGKNIVRNITAVHPLDFSQTAFHKFQCEWHQQEKFLQVFLEREVL